jgi:hypothetical protein
LRGGDLDRHNELTRKTLALGRYRYHVIVRCGKRANDGCAKLVIRFSHQA